MNPTPKTTEQTYLACLTPPGTGAIATLGLYGPAAWDYLKELFQPAGKKSEGDAFWEKVCNNPEPGQFWLGKMGDSSRGGMDQVVLALKSTAPFPWFEIHCHGGKQVIALLEETFTSRGVQTCSWMEFLLQTGTHPVKAAALQALGEATTTRTASILLDQYHGAITTAIQSVLVSLREGKEKEARQLLEELARWVPLGQHLTKPWRVAVAGAPNVGKSSLINRLTGYERCIVSPLPGTTRDMVSTRIAVDGWPVELFDTAGVRAEAEALEKQGIDLAVAAVAGADLCLWLLDSSATPIYPPQPIPALRYVINKMDLPPAWNVEDVPDAIRVSAATGTGLDDLLQAISSWLVPQVPPPGTAVPFTPQLCQEIKQAKELLEKKPCQEAAELLLGMV